MGLVALPFVVSLAVVLRIGAAGITVVAALLVHKGVPLAAALVFTRVAAHASSATRWGLSLPTTVRALAAVGGAVVVMHFLGPLETPPLHGLAAHPHLFTEWLAGAIIMTWALVQLVTSGPRNWFKGARRPSGGAEPVDEPHMPHTAP